MRLWHLSALLMTACAAAPCSAGVKQTIELTSIGSPFDASPERWPALTSPDGKNDAFITYRGIVDLDVNRYRIMIAPRQRSQIGPPRILVQRDCKDDGNVAGLTALRWINAKTLAGLLVDESGRPQVYEFGLGGGVSQVTHADAPVVDFAASRDGGTLALMIARGALSSPAVPSVYSGRVISSESPYDLLEGRNPLQDRRGYGGGNEVVLRRAAIDTHIMLPPGEWPLAGMGLSISPSGRFVVIPVGMLRSNIPTGWVGERTPTDLIFFYGLRIFDNVAHQLRWLVDEPTSWESPTPIRWAANEAAVFVGAMQTGDGENPSPAAAIIDPATGRELDTIDGRFSAIGGGASLSDLRLVSSAPTHAVKIVHYRGTWMFKKAKTTGTLIEVHQNFRNPPRLFAHDLASGVDSLLLDINPGLAASSPRVREFSWKLSGGQTVTAGLYLPVNFETGHRLPLIIQTHGWNPAQFWLDGPSTAGFAARSLAEVGFAVVQIGGLPTEPAPGTEAIASAEMIDDLVDALDAAGIADPHRLGITAWSATGLEVRAALAFSHHRFAAAALVDSRDDGFFNYLLSAPSVQNLFDNEMAGMPYGVGLESWRKNSPMFNLDRVSTPIRLVALGPRILSQWEQWASMKRLGRPIDFVWLPTANHWPVRPSERMEVQQGTVDWYRYWLQGQIDPDPVKVSEYRRWGALPSGHIEHAQAAASRVQ